ncbi:hypothetical protein Golax_020678, partial [Gossypium laxum]|nr:hypothetical protein [Gossypium laxum]
QDALKGNSIEITEDSLLGLKYDPASIWGYFEQLHIEQGPVLELVGFPLTVVKGIATQTGMKGGWANYGTMLCIGWLGLSWLYCGVQGGRSGVQTVEDHFGGQCNVRDSVETFRPGF